MPEHDPEIARLYALAMTHFEDAAMWAVKAATAEVINATGNLPKEEEIPGTQSQTTQTV